MTIMRYSVDTLLTAIQFNTAEILPSNHEALIQELTQLVDTANATQTTLRHYIGFEVSGLIHIGTGISTALKIKKLTDAGVHCSIWLADYHTYLNNKLDGTYATIRSVAHDYFAPVMKACLQIVGCNMDLVDILYAEDIYAMSNNNKTFWEYDIACGKQLTLSRVLKSVSIMGKEAGNSIDFGTLRYPVMQVADAFFMQTHFVHAGMDQRKCHVLMREAAQTIPDDYALKVSGTRVKPIAIHHDLLAGLDAPTLDADGNVSELAKMSKSKPNSAIWVHDSYEEIFAKLKKSYCPMPEGLTDTQIAQIPLIQWSRYMIYPAGKSITLNRKPEHGGDHTFTTYQELFDAYKSGSIHPLDLKTGVALTLAEWFSPIRQWVEQNPSGMNLVKQIKGIK